VVISAETAKRQSESVGGKTEEEILFLMLHGILHLLGYDHEGSPDERRKMEAKEQELFSFLMHSSCRQRA
jgi:probable rRNA maturation factor